MYIEKQRLFSQSPANPQKTSLSGLGYQDMDRQQYNLNSALNLSTLKVESVRKRSAGAFRGNGKQSQMSDNSGTQTRPSNNIVRKSNGSPRFPNIHKPILEFDSDKYVCDDFSTSDCEARSTEFKELLLKEFHRVLMSESKVFNSGLDSQNTYDVKYEGGHGRTRTRQEVLCALKRVGVRTVTTKDEPFKSLGYRIPGGALRAAQAFNTCAVVTSAGALLGSRLGEFIGKKCSYYSDVPTVLEVR